MRQKHQRTFLTCIFVTLILAVSSFAQRIEWAKQLTPDTGWFLVAGRLFWTTNGGGAWRDITPPTVSRTGEWGEGMVAVYFLDKSTGWVLTEKAGPVSEDGEVSPTQLFIAATNDAGTTWSHQRISTPHLDGSNSASWVEYLQFIDAMHGIMNVEHGNNVLTVSSMTIETSDGGRTWTDAGDAPAGPFVFTSRNDGWLVAEDGGLFATYDRGKHWSNVTLPISASVSKETNPGMQLEIPTFPDKEHGFLAARCYGVSSGPTVLYSTVDGGRTWLADGIIPESRDVRQFLSVAGSDWKMVTLKGHKLTTSSPLRSVPPSTAPIDENLAYLYGVSFVDPLHGWALLGVFGDRPDQLLSTSDSGATWTIITPPPAKGDFVGHPPHPKGHAVWKTDPRSQVLGPMNPSGSNISKHLGLDENPVMAASPNMQTWWNTSEYWDTNVYLPGAANLKADPILTDPTKGPAWVTAVQQMGWGIIPTWVGAQPSTACAPGAIMTPGQCTNYFPVASQIPCALAYCQDANNLGVSEANAAIASAQNLGISGVVFYKDVENYVVGTDGAAVVAFLNGWTTTIHGSGFLAGAYGNSGAANTQNPATTNFPQVSPNLDDVWITWVGGMSTWNLFPPLGGAKDTTWWAQHQRIHQYRINKYENRGGINTKIDSDIEDATIVVTPYLVPRKPWSWTWLQFPSPYTASAGYADISGNDINDNDLIVGWYMDSYDPVTGHNTVQGFSNLYNVNKTATTTGTMTYPITDGTNTEVLALSSNVANYATATVTANPTYFGVSGTWPSSFNWKWTAAGGFKTFSSFPSGWVATSEDNGFGINDVGQMSGTLKSTTNPPQPSWTFFYQGGKTRNISFPSLTGTYTTNGGGLNGQGQVVGYYYDGTGHCHGFIWSAADGWTTLDYPGAANTFLYRMNSNGEIMGATTPTGVCQGAPASWTYFLFSGGAWSAIPNPYPTDWPSLTSVNDFADFTGEVVTGIVYNGMLGRTTH